MAYATLSTGYRPGGVNTSIAGAIPLTYGSDRVTNSELGLKGDFFDHQLSISTAIYHISWKNIQLTATDPDSSFSYITNSAAAKSDGFEGTLAWSPVKDLTFTGNLGLTRAVLSEDAPSIAIYGLKGDRLPYSAKTTASLGVVKEFGLAGGWKGHVGATGAYVGDRMMDFESDSSVERLRVPGYSTLDVNAGVKNATWEVNAYVKNVTDRHGLLGKSYNNPNSPSTDNLVDNPIRPRAIGVSVGTSF
jgi:iron complex outermembrane receptor protein